MSWSAENKQFLGGVEARATFRGKAPCLQGATSVHKAVEMLNSGQINFNGNFCVVFSAHTQSYFLLYKAGCKDQAMAAVAMHADNAPVHSELRHQDLTGYQGRRNPCIIHVAEENTEKMVWQTVAFKKGNVHQTAASGNMDVEDRRNATVVYLPGDVQDCSAEEMRADGNGKFDRYNLELTSEVIAEKHMAKRALCIRARDLIDGTFAGYQNFCPGWNPGAKSVTRFDGANGRATEHLVGLLDAAFPGQWDSGEVDIVSFSRGGSVLNQIIVELAAYSPQSGRQAVMQRLWSKVKALHNVDGGNVGGPNYPSAQEGQRAVQNWKSFAPGVQPQIFCHHAPYTMQNVPGKQQQHQAFVGGLRGMPGVCYEHGYAQRDMTIEGHWRCLEEYHVTANARDVQYYSDHYREWINTQIIRERASDGAVMVGCKAGVWIDKATQSQKIRNAGMGGGSAAMGASGGRPAPAGGYAAPQAAGQFGRPVQAGYGAPMQAGGYGRPVQAAAGYGGFAGGARPMVGGMGGMIRR